MVIENKAELTSTFPPELFKLGETVATWKGEYCLQFV